MTFDRTIRQPQIRTILTFLALLATIATTPVASAQGFFRRGQSSSQRTDSRPSPAPHSAPVPPQVQSASSAQPAPEPDEAAVAQAKGMLKRGEELYKAQQYDEARKQFDLAIQLHPKSADAWNHRGHIAFARKDFHSAQKDFAKASDLRPTSSEMRSNLAGALRKLGRFDDAVNSAIKALELNPLSLPASETLEWARIDKLRRDFIPANNLTTAHATIYIQRARGSGDIDDRIRNMRVAVAIGPASHCVLIMAELLGDKSVILKTRGEGDRALECLTTAMMYFSQPAFRSGPQKQFQNDWNFAKCSKERISLLMTMDRHKDAFAEMKTLATKNPSSDLYDWLTKPWIQRKEWDRVLTIDSIYVNSTRPGSDGRRFHLQWRAIHHEKLGKFGNACLDYKLIIENDPRSPQCYRYLAEHYSRRGEYSKAVDEYGVAISVGRGSPTELSRAHLGRGQIRESSGEIHKAQADYEVALSFDPALVEAIRGKQRVALALKESGAGELANFKKALNDLEQALSPN